MIISFDCDDVLAKFTKTLAPEYNRRFGTSYNVGDFTPDPAQWDTFMSPEGVRRMWAMFLEPGYALNMPPEDGAVEMVQCLRSYGIDLIVNTSRINLAPGLTEQWVEKNFGKAFSAVRYAKFNGESGRPTKAQICIEEGACLHIDDIMRHVVDVSSYGINALLLDRNWNQGLLNSDRIKRVYTCADVVDYTQKFM